MASSKQGGMLKAGSHAPDFQLRDLDGQPRPLQELLARGPAVLAFFKITCPVCQYTFPFLERLHQAGSAVQFVGVSQDSVRDTREFNRDCGVTFPTLLDEAAQGYPASNGFGISVVPSLILVEPDGKIAWTSDGFSRDDLEALGRRVGASPFQHGERIPDFKPG
ncbi:MAG: TlpA disulfide reductase family protein [Acidobacteriota bacterium]